LTQRFFYDEQNNPWVLDIEDLPIHTQEDYVEYAVDDPFFKSIKFLFESNYAIAYLKDGTTLTLTKAMTGTPISLYMERANKVISAMEDMGKTIMADMVKESIKNIK
jgi:hypothetical protein